VKPLYIFDLDGTLALIEHRRHYVTKPNRDWPAFFKACVDDEPNYPVISTMLRLMAAGAEVWIFSGRSDEVGGETAQWLSKYCGFQTYDDYPHLQMRRAGDHQMDEKLKEGWLDEMSAEDRGRLVAIFEDRDRMVAMWRRRGIACFQVAPGNF
jgi:hypothetical protein